MTKYYEKNQGISSNVEVLCIHNAGRSYVKLCFISFLYLYVLSYVISGLLHYQSDYGYKSAASVWLTMKYYTTIKTNCVRRVSLAIMSENWGGGGTNMPCIQQYNVHCSFLICSRADRNYCRRK